MIKELYSHLRSCFPQNSLKAEKQRFIVVVFYGFAQNDTFSGVPSYTPVEVITCWLDLWTLERGRAAGQLGKSAERGKGREENKSLEAPTVYHTLG